MRICSTQKHGRRLIRHACCVEYIVIEAETIAKQAQSDGTEVAKAFSDHLRDEHVVLLWLGAAFLETEGSCVVPVVVKQRD